MWPQRLSRKPVTFPPASRNSCQVLGEKTCTQQVRSFFSWITESPYTQKETCSVPPSTCPMIASTISFKDHFPNGDPRAVRAPALHASRRGRFEACRVV